MADGIEIVESDGFIHLITPFLAMALARQFPMIAQFGVESGGRSRRHVEYNLLKPGLGVTAECAGRGSFRHPCIMEQDGPRIAYRCQGGQLDWRIAVQDARTCSIHLFREGGRVSGTFWRMAFAPGYCPVSVWGDPIAEPAYPPERPAKRTLFDVPEVTADFRLPVLLHFPDHGTVRIACSIPGVTVRQTLLPDVHEVGLNLGCTNTEYHTSRLAYHRGTVELAFSASTDVDAVTLELTVEPEHCPQVPGVDLSGRQWHGLRRTWMNAFTLEPSTMTMGDNIVLNGVAHLAMHFKSDQALFTPPLLPGLEVHRFLGRALRLTFGQCVGPEGYISAAYANPARRKPVGTAFFDGCVSSLIALRNHIAATGDWSIARTNVDSLVRAGRFLLALDSDGDGILEMPYHGNGFAPDRVYRNWWDNFPFGHKDAYVNLLAYRALGDLAGILRRLNRHDAATELDDWRQRFAAAFNRIFFNPATGVHAGWISADGQVHDYLFTFVSSMAINQGLVEPDAARGILRILLDRLRAEGYGAWTWGIPGPLISVMEADDHIWQPMQRWGAYENGGCCGQTAYHLIQALYQVGMRDDADAILFTMLDTFEHEPTHSGVFPGYMQSVDWRSREGRPSGYNYLADNYYFLLAGITGHHGIALPPLPATAGA